MVFARKTDDNLTSLVKKLDALVTKNARTKGLQAVVHIIGDDSRSDTEARAKKYGDSVKLKYVSLSVPTEYENGPANWGLSSDAELTAFCYSWSRLAKASFSVNCEMKPARASCSRESDWNFTL